MDPILDNPRRAVFSLLRRRARQAYRLGEFAESLALYDRAWEWARRHGGPDDLDRALCGRASVAIELGNGDGLVSSLREVLMRSANDENCFLAANNLGRAYELKRLPKKAAFYARMAYDRALLVGSREWLASALNLLGNACLAESRTNEAKQQYTAALELIPRTMETWRALIEQNLGYAHVVDSNLTAGFGLLYRSLRALRRLGALRYTASVHVDLAFGHLEAGRPRLALRHARVAISRAEQDGDRELLKNALYLLGEAANLSNSSHEARQSFSRLQLEFFPNSGHLPDFLLAVGVRGMVSLRA